MSKSILSSQSLLHRVSKNRRAAALILSAVIGSTLFYGCSGEEKPNCQDPLYFEANELGKARGTQAGREAGLALTFQEGQVDGKARTYNNAFDTAYASAFSAGEARGKPVGIQQGLSDPSSIANGAIDGDTTGEIEANARATYQGYVDGYIDGYDFGVSVGLFATSCGQPADAEEVQQGRTFCEAEAYNAAFKTAKLSNLSQDYKNGFAQGEIEGVSLGNQDGNTRGSDDGYNHGVAIGRIEGAQIAYDNAYVNQFANTLLAQYASLYADSRGVYAPDAFSPFDYGFGYGIPFAIAGDVNSGLGGSGAGFHDGYSDTVAQRNFNCQIQPSWFGFGSALHYDAQALEPWAEYDFVTGDVVDRFIPSYPAIMTLAERADLDQNVAALRNQERAFNRSIVIGR